MQLEEARLIFSALSQETRLQVFKILIEYGTTGTAAGTLSKRLGIPHNSLSFHLSHLSDVGLIQSQKQGRSIIYSANCNIIENLIGYLQENCCDLDPNHPNCTTDSNTPNNCSPNCK